MDTREQLSALDNICHQNFIDTLAANGQYPLKAAGVDVFQMNICRKCNLFCKHCHVEAGPHRTEMMSKSLMGNCLDILRENEISTIDITGGAPEINPHLEWFLDIASQLERRLIVRSNLTLLLENNYQHFIDVYVRNNVEIVTSLPHYKEDGTNRQRGKCAFTTIIDVIKLLNEKGYGKENSGLVLNLVHNPTGFYLHGSQSALAHEYKSRLLEDHGVYFNDLFCITNMPVGRYLEHLQKSDNLSDYMSELINSFNSAAAENVMCKNTISVSYDGQLYDCDFNQMLGLSIEGNAQLSQFDIEALRHRRIVLANHCYGCTAGSGSSCQGVTEKKEK
jgi:radical SAM/Cys-rich protein